jgi:hypothetical protein
MSSRTSPSLRRALRALRGPAAALALAGPVFAADATPAPPQPAVIPGEIGRTVIDHGDHRTIIIEMVPGAPVPPPPPAPPELVQPPAVLRAAPADLDNKPSHALFWSITVYPGPCSVIEGRTADQRPWRAVSNTDFRLFRQVTSFATARAAYDWFPSIADGEADVPERQTLAAAGLETGPASYRLDPAGRSAEVIDALDYLHAFYDANHAALLAETTRIQAENDRRERELRENPPRKADNIVRVSDPNLLRNLQITPAK